MSKNKKKHTKNKNKSKAIKDNSTATPKSTVTPVPEVTQKNGIYIPNKLLYAILLIAAIALAVMSLMLVSSYTRTPGNPSLPAISPLQSDEYGAIVTSDNKKQDSPEQTTDEGLSFDEPKPPKYTIADTLCLDVKNIMQLPALPNGCEVTSLAIVLNYLGYDITPLDLYLDYMPKSDYETGDPWTTYKGNAVAWGLGCYAPCVVTTGNSYLDQFDQKHITQDVSYKAIDNYKFYLNMGYPVIFWGMLNMQWNPSIAWAGNVNGQECIWHAFSHCMVLIGYTEHEFIFCDPLIGIVKYNQYNVIDCFTAMFKQACVVTEPGVELDKFYEEYLAYQEYLENKKQEETTGPKETEDYTEPYNPYDDIDLPAVTNPPDWDVTEAPEETESWIDETLPDDSFDYPEETSDEIYPEFTEEETEYEEIIPDYTEEETEYEESIPEDTEFIEDETISDDLPELIE